MAGPWDKYQNQSQASGPWAKYAKPSEKKEVTPESDDGLAGIANAFGTSTANLALLGNLPQLKGAIEAAPDLLNGDFQNSYAEARDAEKAREKDLAKKHPMAYTESPDFNGMTNAAVTGGVNSALLNYLPQVRGAVQASPELITGGDYGDKYAKVRDAEVKREAEVANEHPLAYAGGAITGGLVAPMPGLSELQLAKEAPFLARLAVGAGKGAAIGALANPGDKVGEESGDLQLDERAKNAGWGALFGGGAEGINQAIDKAPETIDSIRRWMTSKQLGANTSQIKQLLKERNGAPRLDQIEKFMDENGMLDMGSTYSKAVDKSGQIMDSEGSKIGNIYANAQKAIETNPDLELKIGDTALHGPDLANEFLESEKKILSKKHGGAAALKSIASDLAGTEENPQGLASLGPNASMQDMHNYRVSVDDQIPWNADTTGKLKAQSNQRLRKFLQDKLNQRISAVDEELGSNNLDVLKKANQNYSDAATVNNIATNTKGREMGKFTPGLVGLLGGAGYGTYAHEHGDNWAESILKGTAAGLALRGARAVAPAITYRGATNVAQPLAKYLSEDPRLQQRLLQGGLLPYLQTQEEK